MFSAWSAMFAAPSANAPAYPAQHLNGAAPHAPQMPSQSILGSYTSNHTHNLHSPYTSNANNHTGPRMHGSNNQRGGGFNRGAQNRPNNGGNRPNNNKQHNNSNNSSSPNKNDDLNSNNKRPRSPGHSPPRKKEKKEGGAGDGMPSLSSISLPADDPVDIAAWIAERKKRFPTAAVIAAKQAAHEAAVARGEITDDKRGGKGKGKGGKFQKGPRGNSQNPQQQQQQQRGGGGGSGGANRPHGRGASSSLYVLGREGGGARGEERSDVEDEPTSEEEADEAQAGKAAPAIAPLSSDSPNWKRRLCQWEQPGMKGCRKPASQCSFLHRGEVPPPRHPNAKVTHHSTILSNPAAAPSSTPAVESDPTVAAAQADSTIAEGSPDAQMIVKSELSNPSIDTTNHSTVTSASTEVAMTADQSAPAVRKESSESSDSVSASLLHPAPQPSHPIASLSATTIDRLLQSIRFLVRNGPLRLKIEEPADSSEEDQ